MLGEVDLVSDGSVEKSYDGVCLGSNVFLANIRVLHRITIIEQGKRL